MKMQKISHWLFGICFLLLAQSTLAQQYLPGAQVWRYDNGTIAVRHQGHDQFYSPIQGPAAPGASQEATCGGCNSYGCWVSGGGCNSYGCYQPGASCNSYGCSVPQGGCNSYGCWYPGGSCNSYGCQKKAPENAGQASTNPTCS